MRIAELRLKNVSCFRGEHRLVLGPKVYAVVARMEKDPERSNWLGKSTLLKTVGLVLYGEHDFRTEDEWITDGEGLAEGEIVLDTGHRILRSRERGKRTALYLFEPGQKEPAFQDRAQERIEEIIGLSKQDFSYTCWFRQKQMARFVVAEPSDRMKIVSAWLRLEPLEVCEKLTKEMASDLELAEKKAEGTLAAIDAREKDIAKAATAGGSDEVDVAIKALNAHAPRADEAIAALQEALAGLEDAFEKTAVMQAARTKVGDYERVVADGKAVRADLEKRRLPVLRQEAEAARKKADDATAESIVLVRDAAAKEDAARGEFSGKCPVAKIECPAKARINEDRTAARVVHEEARVKSVAAMKTSDVLNAAERSARASLQEAERIEQRLADLREQAKRLAPEAKAAIAAGDLPDLPSIRARSEKARGDLVEAKLAREKIVGWLRELAEIEKTRETLLAAQMTRAAELGTFREAIAIFGKRGAQRRVAEGALERMEHGANEVLRMSGADMTIEVRWSREGKGLATACDSCGHPFPPSAKVKHCERCGQVRGPKLENKLDIVLSKKSDGAAADLAGAGFQLAASRWLRDARGTRWSTAILDEPFGSLDAAHCRGFSTHLAAMLSGDYGFEQAFVVAHHAGILGALPGRIEIVSDGTHATAKVIA